MNTIRQWIIPFLQAIRNWLRPSVSTPKDSAYISSKPGKLKPRNIKQSRWDKRVQWCENFNRRNGNIVPEKSTISIYYSSHR